MAERKLYASLIGINAYRQSPLDGCIKDILDIDLFLRDFCKQQTNNPIKYEPSYFLSPDDTVDPDYIKGHEQVLNKKLEFVPATFENISTKAFAHLKKAEEGDICFLYYSGHGSQTEAPEVFWHTKPDRQNETIVCVDSRDPNNPDARDLIDKELGYLLWDALNGKKVHCLVIMDCCHSGNNTRALSNAVKFRHMGSARNKIPLEKYIGYKENSPFYKVNNGRATIEPVDYVHLAAALDFEKAQDGIDGGLFTRKLIELLRAGGTQKSYREMMRSVGISVNNRASQQTPVAFAYNDNDLDLPFLGGKMIPYRPAFSIRYDVKEEVWKLYGGVMHGLVPQTTITIIGADKQVTVIEVLSSTSILDKEETKNLEKGKEYEGLIQQIPVPRFTVGISASLEQDKSKLEALKTLYNERKPAYFTINFDSNESADYLVRLTKDNRRYILTSTADDIPLFKRQQDPEELLTGIDAIGKWRGALELQNTKTRFSKEDFDIKFEIIEGVELTYAKLDDRSIKTIVSPSTEDVTLRYAGDVPPALRVSISIKNPSLDSCFVGCLYLSSDYGIYESFIEKGSRLGKQPLEVKYVHENRRYLTIPINIDDSLLKYNINEITEYLKIIVSEKNFDLTEYKQAPLDLDNPAENRVRALGLKGTVDTDWAVFTTRIRVIGPKKERELTPETTSEFADFNIKTPKGFSAKAIVATGNDIQQKLRSMNLRTRDSNAAQVVKMIVPSDDIWGDALTEDVAFSQGLNTPSNNNFSALELMPTTEGGTVELPEGEELLIDPRNGAVITRSIDDNDLEETVIPYAFDIDNELWYPVGYSDEAGMIHIGNLPKPTPGTLTNPGEELTRSLGGSVKLFFKKILRRKHLNSLVLYMFNEDGTWNELTRDLSKMNALLQTKPDGRALLLTHGFTGDTKHIVESLKEATDLTSIVDFVFTYDYENLATPIAKAAESLHMDLTTIGFGKAGMPGLSILAHSQGGLLTRWLVEISGGDKYIRSVILVGVASAGSEFATLGSSVLSLLTHALNGPPVIKLVITGLSFLLKKMELDPGKTLKDTKPGSDFIKQLRKSKTPPLVHYMVIGGDTSLLKDYNGDDGFLKKLGKAIVRKVAFPTLTATLFNGKANDMVVTLESMEDIEGLNVTDNVRTVASNHLAYFREKLIQTELIEAIRK